VRRLTLVLLAFGLLAAGPADGKQRCRGVRHCAAVGHHGHPIRPASVGTTTPTAGASPATGPCTDGDLMIATETIARAAASALCLVNAQRTANGVAPLAEDSRLDAAALAHLSDMVAGNYFAHTSPSGVPFTRWLTDAGFAGPYPMGENIAVGTSTLSTPESIVNAWMSSPGHRANILDAGYHRTGMGAVATAVTLPGDGGTYAQEFGG